MIPFFFYRLVALRMGVRPSGAALANPRVPSSKHMTRARAKAVRRLTGARALNSNAAESIRRSAFRGTDARRGARRRANTHRSTY